MNGNLNLKQLQPSSCSSPCCLDLLHVSENSISRKAMLKRWESLGKAYYNYVKHIVRHIVVHMKHADTSVHNQIDINCASVYLVYKCSPSALCTDGDIRLQGGQNLLEGRVEICSNFQWGTVCEDSWDTADTNVACRQLGFSPIGV